jgi:hypothetical protein
MDGEKEYTEVICEKEDTDRRLKNSDPRTPSAEVSYAYLVISVFW